VSDNLKHITLCLFDILGTSKLIEEKQLSIVDKLYDEMIELTSRQSGQVCFGVECLKDGRLVPVGFVGDIGSAWFSDTFIMWTASQQPRVHVFVHNCINVFCKALEYGIPLRGTISSGEAIMDKEKLKWIGEPIVEAARGESYQKWLGLSFGASFRLGLNWDAKLFIPYTAHIKAANTYLSPFVVDWARYWRENKQNDALASIAKMDTNPAFSAYYKEAIKFYKFSEDNSQWWIDVNLSGIHSYGELEKTAIEWCHSYIAIY